MTTSGEGRPIDAELRNALAELLPGRVAFEEPMARYTSLRVGGPAEALARPGTRQQLVALVGLCRERGTPWTVLGNGFNTIVRDEGLRGVVLRLQELRALERLDGDRIRAQAGVSHTTLTRFCADQGLAGLEFGVGIPGTVGGWLVMNAGIPEREMKDLVVAVELLDGAGVLATRPAADFEWHYRHLELPEGAVLVSGTFALDADRPAAIRERMREHLERRRRTQPLTEPSCGSVFKNPPGERAGRLIEAAGLKGSRAGGAEISTLHANFIVNRGEASSADVLKLIERARSAVAERFGIELETEVRIFGGGAS